MDWDKLRSFHTVAEHLNMAHASRVLDISPSAISRQISSLESDLGCKLFHRHARGLSLTEQGNLMYQAVHEMVNRFAQVEAQVGESRTEPKGLVRIVAGTSLGGDWVAPRLAGFLDTYPEIRAELALREDISLEDGAHDIAIVYERPHEAHLVFRHLMEFEICAYASPEYLAKYGVPSTPEDLDQHRIISHHGLSPFPGIDWLLKIGRENHRPRQPTVRMDNTFAMRRAASTSAGIAPIPHFMAESRPDLVRVLSDFEAPRLDVWLVYPEALRKNRRIEVLIEYLVAEAKRDSLTLETA